MKKAMSVIVIFAVFLISVSAYTSKVVDASEGFIAPFFQVEQDGRSVSLDELKGKYVLLTFWSSQDAVSRIKCQEYTSFARNLTSENNFCHVAVNFDRNENLFNEIVKRDNLEARSQFYAQGKSASQLMSDYRLENGFQSFLVDPQGRIVARNPQTSLLTQILHQ